MKFIRHYRDLNTDLNKVYKKMLKELQANEDLDIVHELEGDNDGRAFRTIIAIRKNVPRAVIGALREVTFTITGGSNDFVIEVHTGSWFNNMIAPGAGGALIGSVFGPPGVAVGAVTGAGISTAAGYNYHRELSNKVRDIVSKYSKNPMGISNVDHY